MDIGLNLAKYVAKMNQARLSFGHSPLDLREKSEQEMVEYYVNDDLKIENLSDNGNTPAWRYEAREKYLRAVLSELNEVREMLVDQY